MSTMRHSAVAALVLGIAYAFAVPPAMASPTDDRIERSALSAMRAPALGGDATLHVRHVATDATVDDDDADERQIPASTMKVITAATSLVTLGEDFRFATRVVEGTNRGRIVLVGGGDPLLTRAQLADLAQRTARKLGRGQSITVDVDDYLFPQPSDAAGWAAGDRRCLRRKAESPR